MAKKEKTTTPAANAATLTLSLQELLVQNNQTLIAQLQQRHEAQQAESEQECIKDDIEESDLSSEDCEEDNEESDLEKLSPDDPRLFKILIERFEKEGLTFDGNGSTTDKLRWLDSMYGFLKNNPHHQWGDDDVFTHLMYNENIIPSAKDEEFKLLSEKLQKKDLTLDSWLKTFYESQWYRKYYDLKVSDLQVWIDLLSFSKCRPRWKDTAMKA